MALGTFCGLSLFTLGYGEAIGQDVAEIHSGRLQETEQHIAVGATLDFEYLVTREGELVIEGRQPGSKRRAVQTPILKAP